MVKVKLAAPCSASVISRWDVVMVTVAPSFTVTPLLVTTGSSFCAVTEMLNVALSRVATPSVTVKVKLSEVVSEPPWV